VPVLTRADAAVISITNATPGPSKLSSIEWEGDYTVRSVRA
jgi:hypothetical protein